MPRQKPSLKSIAIELEVSQNELIDFLKSKGYQVDLSRGKLTLNKSMRNAILLRYRGSLTNNKVKKTETKLDEVIQKKTGRTIKVNEIIKLPRLLAAGKEFNIGLDTMVNFLIDKGFNASDLKPTVKLNRDMYKALSIEFKNEIWEEDFQVKDITRLTIGFGRDGRLVVKYLDEKGTEFETDLEKSPAGFYFTGFNKYSETIRIFEELINDPGTKESDLQKFLEEHPEFLKEQEYREVIPQAVINTDDDINWKADFFLVPHDQLQFCKILELKLPNETIGMKSRSGHMSFSKKLYLAIEQLKDYSKAFHSQRTKEKFKAKYQVDVFHPDLQLIIGRKGDMKLKKEFLSFQKDQGVKVSDWDSYLQSIKRKFT